MVPGTMVYLQAKRPYRCTSYSKDDPSHHIKLHHITSHHIIVAQHSLQKHYINYHKSCIDRVAARAVPNPSPHTAVPMPVTPTGKPRRAVTPALLRQHPTAPRHTRHTPRNMHNMVEPPRRPTHTRNRI